MHVSVFFLQVFMHAFFFLFPAPWDNPLSQDTPSVYCILFFPVILRQTKLPLTKSTRIILQWAGLMLFFPSQDWMEQLNFKDLRCKVIYVYCSLLDVREGIWWRISLGQCCVEKGSSSMALTELFPSAPAEVPFPLLLYKYTAFFSNNIIFNTKRQRENLFCHCYVQSDQLAFWNHNKEKVSFSGTVIES